jgi:hypothetical protein
MGLSMAFSITGMGYYGLSQGRLTIGLNRTGQFQVYCCQLSGALTVYSTAGSASGFVIPEEGLPDDLAWYTAAIKLTGGVAMYGSAEFNFKLYSAQQDKAVYEFDRWPNVRGFITGSMEGSGKLIRLHRQPDGTDDCRAAGLVSIAEQLGFVYGTHFWNKHICDY